MASLPYADVDFSLRSMAGRAEGFGQFAIGGLNGPVYSVTSLEDDRPGSLREGCRKQEPLWIVFEVSGTIHLSSYLSVSSYKTIDGRGQRIKLTGKGLRLKECEHIIVCNLEFEGGRGHDVDGIQIKPNSRHIWIDRCSLRDYDDGLIDITRRSTDITISRCTPRIRVTIHHCFFDGTRQRQPRLRFGKVHLYNNYTRNGAIYAVSQIYSHCNIYEAGNKKKTFEYHTEKVHDHLSFIFSIVPYETQSCTFAGFSEECMFHPSEFYPHWTMEAASASLKAIHQILTGWQFLQQLAQQAETV
ncbi:unnamed protein product [Malus baccata var. baccata]